MVYVNGAEGTRTPDLLHAMQAFSQLNYGPGWVFRRVETGRSDCRRARESTTNCARRSDEDSTSAVALGKRGESARDRVGSRRAGQSVVGESENVTLGACLAASSTSKYSAGSTPARLAKNRPPRRRVKVLRVLTASL